MFKKIFLLAILFATFFALRAQDLSSLSSSDLSNVNIDKLSDKQVQSFLTKAKKSGLTMDQLELAAKKRGMSSLQVTKLRARIRNLEFSKNSINDKNIGKNSSRIRKEEQQDELSFFSSLNEKKAKQSGLQIFGSSIFNNVKPSFNPSINIPAPASYILGVGDEVIIDVYGASEQTYQDVIAPNGSLLISGVGPIKLAGLTFEQAKNRVFNKLSNIYYGVKGRNPSTFIQMSLGQAKTIKVNVVGNVIQPGTYTLSSFSTAFNALYSAGGPSTTGSMRDIEINRNGEKIASLDIYKYLFEGKNTENPILQEGDIIVVKPYNNRVTLVGNVKNPAIYELKNEETFQDLLNISGGFLAGAYTKSIGINRFGKIDKSFLTINKEQIPTTKLVNGDSINITKVRNKFSNRVKITGAVNKAGYFELSKNLSLRKLIKLADGLAEDAYKKRGNIVRLSSDNTLTNISFDILQVVEGNQDILLSPNDEIFISSIFDLEEEKKITLRGAVSSPGTYPFISNMTVKDLVNIAGGLLNNASTHAIEIARRKKVGEDQQNTKIITIPFSKEVGLSNNAEEIQLEPFDLVMIKTSILKETQKVIKIEGQVIYPGYYALSSNEETVLSLIKRAGGITKYANLDGASILRRTEYFRTEYEKQELEALLSKKKKELTEEFSKIQLTNGQSKKSLIDDELAEYERNLIENIRKRNQQGVLESKYFRSLKLNQIKKRDSINNYSEVQEQEAIGLDLVKILDGDKDAEIMLFDGDVLSIPETEHIVRVQGEVLYPTTVKFSKGESFKRFVSKAGGFNSDAKKSKSYIVYANGDAERTRNYLFFRKFPKVKAGASIFIPKKAPRRKISAGEIIGIASSLATLALIVDRLVENNSSNEK